MSTKILYDLFPNKTYIVKVRAKGGGVDGPWSGPLYVTTQQSVAPQKPATPTAVGGDSAINVSWTANSGNSVAYYDVYYNAGSGSFTPPGQGTFAGSTSGTSYAIANLTNGQPYYIKIIAVSKDGILSPPSDPDDATPAAGGVVIDPSKQRFNNLDTMIYIKDPPAGITATPEGAAMRVKWIPYNDPENNIVYQIFMQEDTDTGWSYNATTKVGEVAASDNFLITQRIPQAGDAVPNDTRLRYNRLYYIKIRCKIAGGIFSSESSSVICSPSRSRRVNMDSWLRPANSPPITTIIPGIDYLNVNWTPLHDPNNLVIYQLFIRTDNPGNWDFDDDEYAGETSGSSFVIRGTPKVAGDIPQLSGGQLYYVKIRAKVGNYFLTASSAVSAKTGETKRQSSHLTALLSIPQSKVPSGVGEASGNAVFRTGSPWEKPITGASAHTSSLNYMKELNGQYNGVETDGYVAGNHQFSPLVTTTLASSMSSGSKYQTLNVTVNTPTGSLPSTPFSARIIDTTTKSEDIQINSVSGSGPTYTWGITRIDKDSWDSHAIGKTIQLGNAYLAYSGGFDGASDKSYDQPIYRVTTSDTLYTIGEKDGAPDYDDGSGDGTPNVANGTFWTGFVGTIPPRFRAVVDGGTGVGIRIPEIAKTYFNAEGTTRLSNDAPATIYDATTGYYAWLSELRWYPSVGKWFAQGGAIYMTVSYGIDSGNDIDATYATPSGWPPTLAGTGLNPTYYQDHPENMGHRGVNAMAAQVDYDRLLAEQGLNYSMGFFSERTRHGASPPYHFPMGGTENNKGGLIPEGTRLRIKSTVDVYTRLEEAGYTGDRLNQNYYIAKGLQTYGVVVSDNSGSGCRIRLEALQRENRAQRWAVYENDLEIFPFITDWEAVEDNYDSVAPTAGNGTLEALSGMGNIEVRWTPVNNPPYGNITYEVYCRSADDYSDPPSQSNLIGETTGTQFIITHAGNGTPLSYTKTYYIRLRVKAPGGYISNISSSSVIASPLRVASPDLEDNSINADKISVGLYSDSASLNPMFLDINETGAPAGYSYTGKMQMYSVTDAIPSEWSEISTLNVVNLYQNVYSEGGLSLTSSYVPLDTSATFYFETWVRRKPDTTGDGRLDVAVVVDDKTNNDGVVLAFASEAELSTTWTKYTGTVGPAGQFAWSLGTSTTAKKFAMKIMAPIVGTIEEDIEIASMSIRRVITGSFIGANTIIGDHILADSVDGNVIRANTLDAQRITTDFIVASRNIIAANINTDIGESPEYASRVEISGNGAIFKRVTGASQPFNAAIGAGDATQLTSGYTNAPTGTPNFQTASISPTASSTVLLIVSSASESAALAPTISNFGTWTLMASNVYEDGYSINRRIDIYRAQFGASPGSGLIYGNYAATHTATAWKVIQFNPGTIDAEVILPGSIVTETGLTGSSGTITLNPPANVFNRSFAAFSHRYNEAVTFAETGWADVGSSVASSAPGMSVAAGWDYNAFDDTATASWATGTARWGAIAFEVKAKQTVAVAGTTEDLMVLPTNGGEAQFKGEISAGALTVSGNAIFNGTANSLAPNSETVISSDINPPSAAPMISNTLPAYTQTETALQLQYLAFDSIGTNGTKTVWSIIQPSDKERSVKNTAGTIYEYDSTGKILAEIFVEGSKYELNGVAVSTQATRFVHALLYNTDNGNLFIRTYTHTSTPTIIENYSAGNVTPLDINPIAKRATIFWAGSTENKLWIASARKDSETSNIKLFGHTVNSSTGVVTAGSDKIMDTDITVSARQAVFYGGSWVNENLDGTGAANYYHLSIHQEGKWDQVSIFKDTTGYPKMGGYTWTDSAGLSPWGLTYNSTDGYFLVLKNTNTIGDIGKTTSDQSLNPTFSGQPYTSVAYSYYKNGATPYDVTGYSNITTLAIRRRHHLRVSWNPSNDSNISVRLYAKTNTAASNASQLFLEAINGGANDDYAYTISSVTVSSITNSGSPANVPTGQKITFGNAAILRNSSSTFKIQGELFNYPYVGFRAHAGSGVSWPSGNNIFYRVQFNTETGVSHDPKNMFAGYTFTPPTGYAGYWEIYASIEWANSSTGVRQVRIVNDATYTGSNPALSNDDGTVLALNRVPGEAQTGGWNQTVSTVAYLTESNDVTVEANQESGGALNLNSGPSSTYMYAVYKGK